jgi:hypothetical protein
VAHRVAIDGCPGFTEDAADRGIDFLLGALGEIAGEIFTSVATLLNLDLDLVSSWIDVDVFGMADATIAAKSRVAIGSSFGCM